MPDLTFIIPVAPYHRDRVQTAIASVHAQTLPCEVVVIEDTDAKGAGYIRNQALRRVQTEFCSFLDADDTIEPHFAEMTLALWKPGRYVYTDWTAAGKRFNAPDPCVVWTRKTFHLVNSVIPVEDVLKIGGFDPDMPAAEDTDFGLRLRLAGMCGIRVKEPLVNYSAGGLRSLKYINDSVLDNTIQAYLTKRYGGYKLMGCCGNDDITPPVPGNQQQPGDMLAVPTWTGNRPMYGAATNRFYGNRVGGNKPLWIAPDDYEAMTGLFKRPEQHVPAAQIVLQPGYRDWQSAGDTAFGIRQPPAPAVNAPPEYQVQTVQNTRNLTDKLRLAQRKTGE